MAKVIIKGLTMAQAKTFVEWYEGQGEQDACVWFDENCEDPAPLTVMRSWGYYEIDEDEETVTMYVK